MNPSQKVAFLVSFSPQLSIQFTFFTVPLVVIFTKFDGQIINEFVKLTDVENEDKWEMAMENAESTFQAVYLPKVLDVKYPPKAYVRLGGEYNKYSFLRMETM
jgi:hypothetical protein